MKRIILLVVLISGHAYAQKLPDMAYFKVRIADSNKTIVAEINEVSSMPSIKPNLSYYWYNANHIHKTQGGFSGKLLNGQYNEYYLNKNLKEQGLFKKGLKAGVWKSWKEDGTLIHSTNWNKGVIVPDSTVSFWKKLNFLQHLKKKKTTVPASSTKPVASTKTASSTKDPVIIK